MTQTYAPLLAPLGLTYPQYLVMLVLWEEDGVSVSDLGHRLSLDSGTLSPLLKRLQTAGLVARARDPADERVVRLRLTAKGRALSTKARAIPQALSCKLGVTLAQVIQLREELVALTAKLRAA